MSRLADEGIELAGIAHSAHFPMYSNPPEMWSRITDFVLRTSVGAADQARASATRGDE